jgi:hypothetical protein
VYRWISGVAVAVVMLGVVGIGCGGGGDDTSSSLTKAEYVKQADAICAERKKDWQTALTAYRKEDEKKNAVGNRKVEKELAENVLDDSMLPALETQLESLEDLGAPEGKEKQAEKMVDSLAKWVQGIEKGGTTAVFDGGSADFEEEAKELGVTCPL